MSQFHADFPCVVIRASAGTGKTFRLTNRYLRLALAGEPLDAILATTFTRKAAGEILDRVLLRLAEAAAERAAREKLARELGLESLAAAACRRLLADMLRSLHRMRISTLDSFFQQIAKACSLELDLPPAWRIVEPTEEASLRAAAVRKMLETNSTGDIVRLLELMSKGDVARSVSRQIDELVERLHGVFEETEAPAWDALERPRRLDDAEVQAGVERLQAIDLAKADKRLGAARDKAVAAAAIEDWKTLLATGIGKAIQSGNATYYGKPLPDELVDACEPLLAHARAALLQLFANQTEATYRLLERFDEAFQAVKRTEGAVRFGDVTRRLLGLRLGEKLSEVFYRIDGHVGHLLLDEFQDTSPAQWNVVAPLADRTVEENSGRSFFCVGDVKQAIYGWRGGVAEIFDQIERQLKGVTTERLNHTWRSSPAVVDVVNRVFLPLAQNPIFFDDKGNPTERAEAARRWASRFAEHTTAKPNLPGYWRLAVADVPVDAVDPEHAYWTAVADEIARLVASSPGRSVGVLVRRNQTVATLIHLLRLKEIDASEEGGNPLTDSPAVQVILSALALADHPGDTIARFHVVNSPLGAALELTDHADDAAATTWAAAARRRLQQFGYGPTIFEWARHLCPMCDARDVGRLAQLVELAYAYQSQATVRADDFIEFVEGTRVEDVRSAGVRVMTVHQSKGLEFDVVVLPELDPLLVGQTPELVIDRDDPTRPPRFVLRYVPGDLQPLLPPRFEEMFHQHDRRVVEEALCVLYVAMTRAVHALCMLIKPPAENQRKLPQTFAGLLRGALGGDAPVAPGTVVAEGGDAAWMERPHDGKPAEKSVPAEPPPATIRLAPTPPRAERGLARQSPSGLEGGPRVRLETLLRAEPSAALARGSILHAWFEQIEWLDPALPGGGVPDEAVLRAAAEPFGATPEDLQSLLAQFRGAVSQPAIIAILARPTAGDGGGVSMPATSWTVFRERRFAVREGDALMQGSIDRLVVGYADGKPVQAEVIDYKTDDIPADAKVIDDRVAFYQPQMDAYRRAAAALTALAPGQVSVSLAFTAPGVVRVV